MVSPALVPRSEASVVDPIPGLGRILVLENLLLAREPNDEENLGVLLVLSVLNILSSACKLDPCDEENDLGNDPPLVTVVFEIGMLAVCEEELLPLGFLKRAAKEAFDVDLLLVMLIRLSNELGVCDCGGGDVLIEPILKGWIKGFTGGVAFFGDPSRNWWPDEHGDNDMDVLLVRDNLF